MNVFDWGIVSAEAFRMATESPARSWLELTDELWLHPSALLFIYQIFSLKRRSLEKERLQGLAANLEPNTN